MSEFKNKDKLAREFMQQGFGSDEAWRRAHILTKKPNINDVFTVFQDFISDQKEILVQSEIGERERRFEALREVFREKLESMGLAEYIDWTDQSRD